MSKKGKIITIVLIVVICIIGVIKFTNASVYIRWYLTPYLEKKLEGFDEHKSDYQLIVDKLIKLRDEGKVVKKDDYLIVEEDILYSVEADKKIKLTFAEKQSLENVKKTFTGEFCIMNKIMIPNDNYIEFASSECDLRVVYSKSGSKPPSFVENKFYILEYKIKKIADKWYTVEDKKFTGKQNL